MSEQPVGGGTTRKSVTAFHLAAGGWAMVYIGVIATVASTTGMTYVLFPELGAISHEVLTHPRGRWASAPHLLVLASTLAGLLGIAVTRTLPYGTKQHQATPS